jgi:Ion channel
MLAQLLVSAAASFVTIAIHSVWTVHLSHSVRRYWFGRKHKYFLLPRILLMIIAVTILATAHVFEVLVWAAVYRAVGATPEGASNLYLAFVSYATLGYGDVVPVPQWQLLGPLTAMNGILLFGWSTAMIFEVVRTSFRDGQH